jgi:hypothetical protein
VRQADGLNIEVVSDKRGYFAPGEEASLAIKVTDDKGHPVLAALGLWAVDEAVFALSELRPGMEQVFFLLEQEIMRPKVEIHAFEPDEVFFPGPREAPPEPQLAKAAARPARVLAAAAMPSFVHASTVDSRSGEEEASQALWVELFSAKAKRAERAMREFVRTEWRMPSGREVYRELRKAGIDPDKTRDWFGVPFQVTVAQTVERVSSAALMSAGPDATWNTADDMSRSLGIEDAMAPVWEMESRREEMRWQRGGVAFGVGGGGGGADLDMIVQHPMMAREMVVLEGK